MLSGKVALVTGAGLGIGRGIARCLSGHGATVVIAEVDAKAGQECARELQDLGGRALFVSTDVSQQSQVEAAVAACIEHFGRLDILVNNAVKVARDLLLEEKTDAMLAEQLAIGVWGPWWAMRAALPHMREAGGGRIINFTSGDVQTGAWLHSDYNIAKGAVEALTRSAANEWARFNILVNAVAPVAASSAYETLCRERPGFAEAAKLAIPLGRVGDPECDVAPVVAFLASDAARYITGSTLLADGGVHLSRVNPKPQRLLQQALQAGQPAPETSPLHQEEPQHG